MHRYLLFISLYVAVYNGFEAVKIHYEGHWKGWALEIETVLGLEMATCEASAIWAPTLSVLTVSRRFFVCWKSLQKHGQD